MDSNKANSNDYYSIGLTSSNSNMLKDNIASNKAGYGIFLESSNNNTLNNNTASYNAYYGIFLLDSSGNLISSDTVNSNEQDGIYLGGSDNIVVDNNVSSNIYGFFLPGTYSNNTLSDNIVNSNKNGIYIYNSSNNNIIYNNVFNNTNNFVESSSINTWNITRKPGTNIIGGLYLGGNFWAYPNGTGFSQTCTDSDNDGICDSPYVLDSNNTDYLPLSHKLAVTPTPTLTVSPQSGQQGTIFQYSGNNYTPNGAIDWHVMKPDGIEYPVGSLTADSSGNLTYQYSSSCNSMVGSYSIWAIDRTTGKKSNDVTQTISAAPSCTVAIDFKLPLLGGKSWLLTVQARDGKTLWGEIDYGHVNRNALDFDDLTKEDGKLKDVPVLAAADGKVIDAGGTSENTFPACFKEGYKFSKKDSGYYVEIKHKNGLSSVYYHLANPPIVEKGNEIIQGQQIGIVGNTGCSGGSHIHFEILPKNSANFLIEGKTIDYYKVGTIESYKYYPSTNTVIYPPTPTITITSPNGGENWQSSSTQTIKWSYTGNPGADVKIELLKSGILNRIIISKYSIGSAGAGTYDWKIPSNQILGTDYKIRITSTTNSAYTATSNGDFSISAPSKTVPVGSLGLDYSFARPNIKDIAGKGYKFVARYLSYTPEKNIDAKEYSNIKKQKMAVVLVWESTAKRPLDGYKAGVSDAKMAVSQAASIGAPKDVVIYFAVDFDASESQQNAINNYLNGAASVIGKNRVGVYGGYYVVKRSMEAGFATYGWQTIVWSGGQIYTGANIYQNGKQDFCSAKSCDADIDVALKSDIGAS